MDEIKYLYSSHNISNLVYNFVASVGKFTSENVIAQYVKNQGVMKEYKQLYLLSTY